MYIYIKKNISEADTFVLFPKNLQQVCMFQIKIILCHSSNVTLTILTVFGLEAVTVLICMRTLFSWMEKDFLTEDLKETSGTFSQWVNRGAAAVHYQKE